MDARPYRPRGAENMVHSLHQRHKSTGNLSGMTAITTVGLRGNAKRAAFGDVTNLAKNTNNGRDDFKIGKAQAVIVPAQVQPALIINKENPPLGKDLLSRPAQRAVALGNKCKAATSVEARFEVGRKSIHAYVQDSVIQPHIADADVQRRHGTSNAVKDKFAPSLQGSLHAPPLQPRHHKSQPQLKQQQPTLRKTQSKQFERTDLATSKVGSSYINAEVLMEMPPESEDQSGGNTIYLDSLCFPTNCDSQAEENSGERYVDMPSKLPNIYEEPDNALYVDTEGRNSAPSEPEECWEEEEDDDEDYDDQDQAYATAHSTRSRDLTTRDTTTVLAPRLTTRVQRELLDAKMEVEQTRPQEDIDDELWDVSMVAEYGEEIFEYMRELEIKMLPNPHYMEIQTEIQWSMRSVLMDWLVQVHNRFNLLPETLFLTVNYIDRFLSCKVISIGKLQLVGATAILVASKYEEINCPSLEEIVYMVDGGYSTEEILKAERFMLSMLSFELGWPGPMSFLRRVSKADDYDLETRTLAKYFLELTIMDERFVASPPSFLAAGAHCLSRLILKKGDWTKHHVHYSGYTWNQLKSLVAMMIECCVNPRLHHSAVFDKYSEKRFKEASTLVQRALDAGFTLPQHSMPVRPLKLKANKLDDASDQFQCINNIVIPLEG